MNFLDNLQAHKGGLVQLKTQLYWYSGRGWDNNPGRVCLVLDAAATAATTPAAAAVAPGQAAEVFALLLVDGQPRWIWVAEQDVELL